MSHLTERKEQDCLNCGAEVNGRYCHVCGQENIEPKESFWHLVTHFVYDVTHFDGKFFSTLRYLLFKPGFLSHEYLRGRRAAYLHPIRMYVFTSAIFFLIFFSANQQLGTVTETPTKRTAAQQMKRIEKLRAGYLKSAEDSTMPSIGRIQFRNAVVTADSDIARLARDSTYKNKVKTLQAGGDFNFLMSNAKDSAFKNEQAYDSAQAKLPTDQKDNFIIKRFRKQKIHLNEKYNHDGKAIWQAVQDKFTHLFPQMLFASLPMFALMLQLLYARRKSFFYVNHVVFTIHLYCGIFIIILAGMLVDYLLAKIGQSKESLDNLLFGLASFFFMYKSMRNFYRQRRAKTILKYLIMLFLSLILMAIIFVIFFIFSAMAI